MGCAEAPSPEPPKNESLVQRISSADAARIKYSKQRFVYLDIGETASFRLADGRLKRIRLVSVEEKNDSVIQLMRRADVRLEVDGGTLDLRCGPYVLPIVNDGLRLQADTTSGWLQMGNRVQLSLWDARDPGIREGAEVKRGQEVGTLGRKGPSGNYSHLHLGLYLSRKDFDADRPCRNLNLYPWILTAYQAAAGTKPMAVARPHHTAVTGEKVVFDGRKSIAIGAKIISYRWEFLDGTSEDGPIAAKVFDRPGAYTAVLHIEDDRGGCDIDICRVRIYTASKREDVLTTLFFSVSPSFGIRLGEAVHFRGWPQGGNPGPIRLDFGDGEALPDYKPFFDAEHRYEKPGTYIVTASAEKNGRPAMTKLKVVVE